MYNIFVRKGIWGRKPKVIFDEIDKAHLQFYFHKNQNTLDKDQKKIDLAIKT